MDTRHWKWIGAWLLMPALATAADTPAAQAAAPTAVANTDTRSVASLDLKDESVQRVLRAAVSSQQSDAGHESEDPLLSPMDQKLGALRFRAPRRVHHTECNSLDCVAYTADDEPLFTYPRDQMWRDQSLAGGKDVWLSCQDGDDLLTTFERYDKCRGVTIGLPPLRLDSLEIRLPGARL